MATKKQLNDDGQAVSTKPGVLTAYEGSSASAAPTSTAQTPSKPTWRERVSGKLGKSKEVLANAIGISGGPTVVAQGRRVIATPWGVFYDSEALQASLDRAKERTALLAVIADIQGMRIGGGAAADRMDELISMHRHTPAASLAMAELSEALRSDAGSPLADQVHRRIHALYVRAREIIDGPDVARCERAPDALTVKPDATQPAGTGLSIRELSSPRTYNYNDYRPNTGR